MMRPILHSPSEEAANSPPHGTCYESIEDLTMKTKSFVLTIALFYILCGQAYLILGQGGNAQNVVWINRINTEPTGNTLQKLSGNPWFDAGATSQQQVTGNGGYIEFTPSFGHRMVVGLSTDASDSTDGNTINFALGFWPDGGWDIRESGVYIKDNTYSAGDVFRIAIEGGQVKYYRNNDLLHQSGVAPTYPMVMDTSMGTVGSTISNAVIKRQ